MKIVAFDAALAATGWAVMGDGDILIAYGVIETAPRSKNESQGQSDFRRVTELYRQVRDVIVKQRKSSDLDDMRVVVERTDWSPGRRSERSAWVRESIAREALAMGVTTVFLACDAYGVAPIIVGPNEWHLEFGAAGKESVADVVARTFPTHFDIVWRKRRSTRVKAGYQYHRAAVDRKTGKGVPDHVTDAIAMAYVVVHRQRLQSRILEAEAQ